MNASNAKDYLPLVQALADGKTIQRQTPAGWVDLTSVYCEYPPGDYRIKSEPREWTVRFFTQGQALYDGPMPMFNDGIRVREILD